MVHGLASGRTQLSLRVTTAVATALTLVLASSPPPVLADGNPGIHLAKTVDPAQTTVNPALAITLGVDKASAIPGDTLTYTADVTNAFSIFGMGGTFRAEALGNVDGTVAYYWDELEVCNTGCGNGQRNGNWVAFAGFVAGQPGYQPVIKPDAATGLILTATSVPATGVTYPAGGDPILGTDITPQSTATWNYQSVLIATASQIATLSDPTQVQGLRNVVHFEVTTRNSNAAQPYLDAELVNNPFQSKANVGAVTNIVVTFNLPDGTKATVDSSTVAGLALLAPGGSIAVTTTFKVPAPAGKAAGETDSAYLARLSALEGSSLNATASASGTGFSGPRTAIAPQVTTAEHLPIVTIFKSGPTQVTAGNIEVNPLTLQNIGGAGAVAIAVTDSLPGGATGTVTGAPAGLIAAQSGTAQATYDVPASQAPGNLTDTAAVTWQDANGNKYGPLSSSFTTSIQSSLAGARLTLSPATAGPDIVGNTQSFTANFVDTAGKPLVNKAIKLTITGANPGTQTASTDSNGNAQFSYRGLNQGTDQVQATFTVGSLTLQSNTVSVAWIAPITAVSTTLVTATVFHGSCCGFSATPASTPVFSMNVPTIDFNPPAGTIPHNPTQIGVFTRPMFDVTTDVAGNFTGAIELKGVDSSGVLHEAGTGDLFQFDMVLTGTFTIAAGGNLTFNFFSDDGFIFGIPGATRVAGPLVNPPASMLTAFNGYPVMGAFNQPTAPIANNVTVSFPAAGTYPYEIDYNECCAGQLALTLATNGTGLPPTGNISLTPFNIAPATVGQTQPLHVAVMDASGAAIGNQPVAINVTGANPQTLTGVTDSTGLATINFQGANAGVDSLQATAQVSGVPEVSNVVTMTWNPAPPAPTISTPSPADGSIVTKPIAISALITPPAGQSITTWSVTYQVAGGPPVGLGQGTGTPPTELATFDPTLLVNGTYTISITANASGGGQQTLQSTVAVLGGLKIGRYTTTFQDMAVAVAGNLMEVRRTYDSIDTATSGDFGFGWRIGITNFRVATNRTLGAGGWTQYNTSCALGLCLTAFKNSGARFVTIVFPNGHTEVFDFVPAGGTNVFFGCTPVFIARASLGTTSKLVPLDDTGCSYTGDGNLYGSNGIYNPQRFQLTTHDGRVYVIDHTLGMISMSDRNGNTITVNATGVHASSGQGINLIRDSSGRITAVQGPVTGMTATYTYSPTGDLQTSTDALGNTNTYSYDGAHHLLKVTGPQGAISSETYDSSGRLISITDASGHTTQIQNNVGAQTATYIDAIGATSTVVTADDFGDVVREDISSGGQTLTIGFAYDSAGHVTQKTDALGHTIHAAYDGQGDLIRYTDANGNPTQLTYDANGLITSVMAPDSETLSSATYDANGNPITMLGPGGAAVHLTYNSAGQPLTRTDAAGNTISYIYDSGGRLAFMGDPAGRFMAFQYDNANRVLSIKDPSGASVHFKYDGAGNVIGVTDQLGGSEAYTYNSFGNVTSATDQLGATASVTYDADGHVTGATDRAGNSLLYTYDADGRLTRVNYPGGEFLAITLDGFGRPTTLANSTSSIDNSYDAAGNLVATTAHAPAFGSATLSYTYDAAGNRLTATGPDGRVSYGYDSNGRLVTVTDARGGLFGLHYDSASRITTLTRPNGITDSYSYNTNGRLVGIASTLGGTTIQSLTQSFDANGQVASSTDAAGTTSYTHDVDGRLVAVSGPGAASQSFSYDQVGNRAFGPGSTTSTHNAADELTSDTNFTYTYDAEGRRTSKVDRVSGATTRYVYNGAKQLTSIQNPDGTTTSYTYDPMGRRLTVSAGGTTTAYVYDGVNARLEYGSAGLAASYVGAGDVDRPLEMTRGANSYYYLQNFQGSVTGLTNASGAVAASYSYDAFGVPTSAPSTVTNPFTFAGREYDAKTGLYYNRTRYYEPATGSFISQDLVASGQPYAYAGNDPVDFTDPSGGLMAEIASLYARATSQANRMKTIGCGLAVVSAVIEIYINVATKQKLNWASFVAMAAGVVTSCTFGYMAGGPRSFSTLIGLPFAAGLMAALVDLDLELVCASETGNWSAIHPEHVIAIGLAAFVIGASAAIPAALLPASASFASQLSVAWDTAVLSGEAAGGSDALLGGGACG